MNRHAYCQELISRLLDEDTTLTAEENAALQAHLAECADCAAVYAAFSALSEALGEDLEEPPASLHENVMAEVRREEIRRRSSRRHRWTWFAAAAAALALVIGFAPRASQMANENGAAKLTAGIVNAAPAEVLHDAAAGDRLAVACDSAEAEEYEEAAPAAYAAESAAAAPAALRMDALLAFLDGTETAQESEAAASPTDFRIETDEGVLEIVKRGGALCYRDPRTGALLVSTRGEEELLTFLREHGA